MTCADVLTGCTLTNRAVEALLLSDGYRYADELAWTDYYHDDNYKRNVLPRRLDTVLGKEFSGWTRLLLPTLFDKTDSFLNGQRTQALMPACVNLQTLGKHVLLPRPYGPRMPVADAVRFIAEVEPRDSGIRANPPNEQWIRARGLDKTWHWTRASERVYQAAVGTRPTDFDPDYDEMWRSLMQAVTVSTVTWDPPSLWEIQHMRDPPRDHPVDQPETLRDIAGYFKDGFPEFKNCPVDYCKGDTADSHPLQDKYDADIQKVMDRIDHANPGKFDHNGNVTSTDWDPDRHPRGHGRRVRTAGAGAPRVARPAGALGRLVVLHVHGGGIHCGTNVLRSR